VLIRSKMCLHPRHRETFKIFSPKQFARAIQYEPKKGHRCVHVQMNPDIYIEEFFPNSIACGIHRYQGHGGVHTFPTKPGGFLFSFFFSIHYSYLESCLEHGEPEY